MSESIACIGMGVIGCGWASHFSSQGIKVHAWDPDSKSEDLFKRTVEQAWPSMEKLGLANGASPDLVVFHKKIEEAVENCSLVQESSPERLELKQELLSTIDKACSTDCVIASSTSGYLVSDLALNCSVAPERVVVGHPFNPVYLLPLVELVAGPQTSVSAMDRAEDIYSNSGKTVLRLEKEIDGFIADRLQEAMWREALHMVANGEATVEQLDLSITAGPGLRWALMGPMLTFHLAGGEGGMAHMLDHFGPSLQSPWTRLKAPELTEHLRNAVVDGCSEEAAGRSVADLVIERDKGLTAIIQTINELNIETSKKDTNNEGSD
ncbi:MAG: 3-hydroxyacyl-CoA dehydrogenase NAD-binding domain-containing protein [Acidimicrobiales bacterium]|jgi:carnitine 3-dehydrogenase|nr:3-hydroxybutyryl-CoA dehydrogenase [Acidimicrobiaceae bacterium]MDP6161468.1 3-hydroxyacyl-CoA dehydrogenase NAD-binding domain-containing protein [Acidimicrobiales bacterium]MDP6285687.1 3-hydroxyacyl-CoA dehydrogenase NAD-binding domain-containing protein [Acidimicrobiales bacterium]HJL90976.1 3-hydroxyacyl-CoA dehydrogenase NAD-binding domain-containing protein [Acidimicrobiales bacterium]HJO41522.1 3-hydroxyacyl-CoA dehydrogenase NAD-binding domain-containing protein [Acidimicrobiales ba|tara:strand:- start:458 stop:1426 length:969 start_codon:yes stop_codon:yes gene_type:complete